MPTRLDRGVFGAVQWVIIFLMWIGRLEIFPVHVLLTRAYWRS